MVASQDAPDPEEMSRHAAREWGRFCKVLLYPALDAALEIMSFPHGATGLRLLALLFYDDVIRVYRRALGDDAIGVLYRRLDRVSHVQRNPWLKRLIREFARTK